MGTRLSRVPDNARWAQECQLRTRWAAVQQRRHSDHQLKNVPELELGLHGCTERKRLTKVARWEPASCTLEAPAAVWNCAKGPS